VITAKQAGGELPGWLHDAAKLEPFSAETWQMWAELAWRVLAEISPNGKPAEHQAFYDHATKICNVRKQRRDYHFGKVVSSPSIAENDIKEALFDAFALVATGTSRRTKRRQKTASAVRK
jgi:hypothetical protein